MIHTLSDTVVTPTIPIQAHYHKTLHHECHPIDAPSNAPIQTRTPSSIASHITLTYVPNQCNIKKSIMVPKLVMYVTLNSHAPHTAMIRRGRCNEIFQLLFAFNQN